MTENTLAVSSWNEILAAHRLKSECQKSASICSEHSTITHNITIIFVDEIVLARQGECEEFKSDAVGGMGEGLVSVCVFLIGFWIGDIN